VNVLEVAVRAAYAALIIGGCIAAYYGVRALVLARARRSARRVSLLSRGVPGIVYFTTPDCAICKAVQRPALNALQARCAGRIEVVEVDACQRPDLAKSWSVLSVPTTFVLDGAGRPLHVNHGAVSMEKLLGQLPALTGNCQPC
jgi:thioredoxin-like negative regulator of GroEL